ncbi:MAG: 50S ribosomal protein L10 [Candidatus Omnitrophica bacterium]|nr:50S ribosomal protein L10 [bacterium]NUN95233.1 50S ribosomal protein L10 [Candidatus Omnitrophota bacterium]
MDRNTKAEVVAELTEKFDRAKAIVFSEFKGISVKQANLLRRECGKAGLDYIVAKNTLIRLALPAELRDKVRPFLTQTTAVAVDYGDGVTGAKTLFKVAKDIAAIKPKAGILENEVLNSAQVEALSKMPSKEELLAKILGSVQAPPRNLLGCINGVATKLAGLFKAYHDKLEQQAA